MFQSISANAYGEFAANLSYPTAARVEISQPRWAGVQDFLAMLPEAVQSVDISLDAAATFLDDSGDEVSPDEVGEDCLQFQCYRFVRQGPERFAFYLVLAAKYHDSYVRYELTEA